MISLEIIARAAHEVNRAYCAGIGDTSQLAWDDAPDWQRASAIMGVSFHVAAPRTPEESHNSWMAQKVADGWSYGAYKDPENKKHPCMCSYSELPAEQRIKDHLFKAVVDTLKDYA